MLGNLAAFLYSGVNMTANLLSHLDQQHHPSKWTGTYKEALPYLQNAFAAVLDDLAPRIDERVRDAIVSLVAQLCNPDLSRRGHPKGLGRFDQYSLERFVSLLDLATRRLEIRVRIDRQSA